MKNKIKALRVQMELTQVELAKLCGISMEYVKKLEYGQRTPSLRVAKKLSEIFECSVEDLFETKYEAS